MPQCQGHDFRHDYPFTDTLFDVLAPLYLMAPWSLAGPDGKIPLSFLVDLFTLVDSVHLSPWVSCVPVPPLLRFLYQRGHGRAVTFPLIAEGHGLA